jgi:feruloyl esterase
MSDGVEDGIIENPGLCDFDPSRLLCAGNSTNNCLTQPQVLQLKQIYSDYKYPNGHTIFPAMQPGSEVNAADGLYAGTAWKPSEVRHTNHIHYKTTLKYKICLGLVQIRCI